VKSDLKEYLVMWREDELKSLAGEAELGGAGGAKERRQR